MYRLECRESKTPMKKANNRKGNQRGPPKISPPTHLRSSVSPRPPKSGSDWACRRIAEHEGLSYSWSVWDIYEASGEETRSSDGDGSTCEEHVISAIEHFMA